MSNLASINRSVMERAAAIGLTIDCLGDGDVNSEVLIIGEAPGRQESQMKMPLVGPSGKFIWECLREYGITRTKCYITNVIKKQLVDDVEGKQGVSKNEVAHWQGILDYEVSQLPNIRYVLLLGSHALRAFTGHEGIEQWRGTVLTDGGKQIIIAYNPANLMRKPSLEPIFKLDISKLEMCRRGLWSEYNIEPYIDPSPAEAIRWCDKMIQEDTPVSFDIEVIGNETACVGFANSAHEGMCINFREREDNRWSLADERRVRAAIQRVVRHSKVRLVAQNGGFDSAWLWYKDRIKVRPLWLDTLLAHHTLHPTWPHNLGFLTAQYTTHPFYKDEKDDWREGGDISSFWIYNVKDCCITWTVAKRLQEDLVKQGLDKFFHNHVMRLQPHLVGATVLGNKIDLVMKAQLSAEYQTELQQLYDTAQHQIRTAVGDAEYPEVNLNSPKQLGELFFRTLHLVGKGVSTNEDNRNAMIDNPRTKPICKELLITINRYKEKHKLFSTYIESKVDPDGRMRSDYKQYGTQFVPGRLSSAQTLWGSGMNLQNQPEMLRGMFIADKVLVND
ncbi:PolA DNA polymerase I - 3'-5' exonuclease and polymerase domains [uncultured Caudovirales phage]|uniref:PolA DNA polymerase I - 3'-5' exonuclease and polymerase domains n=1 Tax=uncultured Caudovirales phage TaxID=2100421 RepID=A0A6J5P6N7_9CAUD|nr:PolA DNA polymerase I - 3'-5' exonuclease and polymerase domains [uncultured Caudovirales phage]